VPLATSFPAVMFGLPEPPSCPGEASGIAKEWL
jgi:hypothetical protein